MAKLGWHQWARTHNKLTTAQTAARPSPQKKKVIKVSESSFATTSPILTFLFGQLIMINLHGVYSKMPHVD